MSIKRMLMLASMALAAIAFAAPAAAQANVTLSDEGKALKKGAKVTATSGNLITVSGLGTLECDSVTLHLEVATNGPHHVVLNQLGEAGTEGCSLSGVNPVTITDGTLLEPLTIDTWGTGVVTATFESHIFGESDVNHEGPSTTCHFEGDVRVQGRASGNDILDVEQPSLLNGPCGQGEMSGDFTMETSNGVPVNLNFVKTP